MLLKNNMMFLKKNNSGKKIVALTMCDICYEEKKGQHVSLCGNKACNFNVCNTCGKQHVQIKNKNSCPACQQDIKHNKFNFVRNPARVRPVHADGVDADGVGADGVGAEADAYARASQGSVVSVLEECGCGVCRICGICNAIDYATLCTHSTTSCRRRCTDYCMSDNACCIKREIGQIYWTGPSSRFTCCYGICATECLDSNLTCMEDWVSCCCITSCWIGCCFITKAMGFYLLAGGSVGGATAKEAFLCPKSFPALCLGEMFIGLVGWAGLSAGAATAWCLGGCVTNCAIITGTYVKDKCVRYKDNCSSVLANCMERTVQPTELTVDV